jgi:hypothetical protein
MQRWIWLVSCLMTLSLVGCADYYARRAARREQRLALREQQRYQAEQQRYQAEQQRLMEMCGDPQRTFERGHNAGLSRQPMDTSWVAQCPPHVQQQQGQAYVAGYQQGASIAPAPVVMQAPRPQPVIVMGGGGYAGGVVSCRFSSDCGPQMSCRQWNNMGQVCMGFGGSGSPCWFSSDCLSGSCDARVCR